MADELDSQIAAFAKRWFARLSLDEEAYDLSGFDDDLRHTHDTLDHFFEELCELVVEAEVSARSADAGLDSPAVVNP